MANKSNKNFLLLGVLALGAAAVQLLPRNEENRDEIDSARTAAAASPPTTAYAGGNEAIERAYAQRSSNVQIEGSGIVSKLLQDDNEGSRHQRFILQLGSERTLLVAHNIDLAPRIELLREGDTVRFFGEYEWNDRGGVIHWTHEDPMGRHVAGWLEHEGKRYR